MTSPLCVPVPPEPRPRDEPRPQHIACVISSLGTGGAERVMTLLANGWVARGHRVTLVTLDRAEPFYALDARVRRVPLGVTGPSAHVFETAANTAKRVRAIRRALRTARPDVCVSFIDRTNVLVLAATRGLGFPVIVSERVHPGHLDPRFWGVFRAAAYVAADAVVAQTHATAAVLRRPFGTRVLTIPNPVLDPGDVGPVGGSRVVAAAGRLVHQKGFDLLLRAFHAVARERKAWRLVIWGEGSERARLERLAADLGLADRVDFPGKAHDLPRQLARADIFVLSSRFEGFPNVLCEAMAVGLPVVSFRCPTGPEDIVRDGVDGMLVRLGDVDALGRAIARLIDDPALRARLGQRARAVRERYALEAVLSKWDEAFQEVGA